MVFIHVHIKPPSQILVERRESFVSFLHGGDERNERENI